VTAASELLLRDDELVVRDEIHHRRGGTVLEIGAVEREPFTPGNSPLYLLCAYRVYSPDLVA